MSCCRSLGCHFATQYNREIPNEEIDMDFMNLNQAAHGDREHGFIGARLRKPRKIIAGYWQDADVQARIGSWMRTAIGVDVSKQHEGHALWRQHARRGRDRGRQGRGAEAKLGWEVNTWAVGDLVQRNERRSPTTEIDALMDRLPRAATTLRPTTSTPIRYQAREEIAMKKMLDARGLPGVLQHLPGPLRHGAAARPGQLST